LLDPRRHRLERRVLATARVKELDVVRHDLGGGPAVALGVFPRTRTEPAVDGDACSLRKVLRANLRLAVPRRDGDEVRSGVAAGTIDGEQERRHLLVGLDVLQLDRRGEISDQRDDVHSASFVASRCRTGQP
jgi:hypothetical protein